MAKPQVVFVLGRPGSGKGTQCSKICQEFKFVHLSAGDLLREEQHTAGSQYGDLIANCIVNAQIVPVEITCSLLEKAMRKHMQAAGDGNGRFLIDGFPRNEDNYSGWQTSMAGKADVKFVLYFETPEDVCMERCLNRGKAGSGRADDNEDSLRKRMANFVRDTCPIVRRYDEEGRLKVVNGSQDPDQVFHEVKSLFSQFQ